MDFTGFSTDGKSVNYVGVEGGYVWFVAQQMWQVTKPRYNITTDDNKAPQVSKG